MQLMLVQLSYCCWVVGRVRWVHSRLFVQIKRTNESVTYLASSFHVFDIFDFFLENFLVWNPIILIILRVCDIKMIWYKSHLERKPLYMKNIPMWKFHGNIWWKSWRCRRHAVYIVSVGCERKQTHGFFQIHSFDRYMHVYALLGAEKRCKQKNKM